MHGGELYRKRTESDRTAADVAALVLPLCPIYIRYALCRLLKQFLGNNMVYLHEMVLKNSFSSLFLVLTVLAREAYYAPQVEKSG